jgi:hypothetical protein
MLSVSRSGKIEYTRWISAAAFLFLLSVAAHAGAQTPAEPPPPPPPTDLLKRGELFGDWGGARTKLEDKGTKIGASFTQFFDWVPVGDDDRGYDYGGKIDVVVRSNLSKYLWEDFWSADTSRCATEMSRCLPAARSSRRVRRCSSRTPGARTRN